VGQVAAAGSLRRRNMSRWRRSHRDSRLAAPRATQRVRTRGFSDGACGPDVRRRSSPLVERSTLGRLLGKPLLAGATNGSPARRCPRLEARGDTFRTPANAGLSGKTTGNRRQLHETHLVPAIRLADPRLATGTADQSCSGDRDHRFRWPIQRRSIEANIATLAAVAPRGETEAHVGRQCWPSRSAPSRRTFRRFWPRFAVSYVPTPFQRSRSKGSPTLEYRRRRFVRSAPCQANS
jgi:hypothetical protein